MRDLLNKLQSRLLGAWRFRIPAIGMAWAIAVLGGVMVFRMPDIYQANARIYIDTESVLRPLLDGLAVGTDVMQRVNMMSTALFSRPNLEKLARETDLYLRANTVEEHEALITSISRRMTLTPGTHTSTYTISFQDTDPQMAERVVKTLLTSFVEDTLGIKREDSKGAQEFLVAQLREYEQRLREAEDRLAEFKKKNLGVMPGEGGDYYTRLQNTMAQVNHLRDQLRIAEERRQELLKQIEGEEPTIGLDPNEARRMNFSPLDAQLAEYESRLEALLLQYTEKHPQVIALRELIEDTRLKRDAEMAARGGTRSSSSALATNPVYQNMKIALSRTEVEIAQLRAQLASAMRDVGDLRSKVDTIPEVEAQLARLNRDYQVNQAQYTALLQRLESARLSDDADSSTENVKFRIIEPPRLPLQPIGPNRPLLLSFVLILSLGIGVALAVVLNELRPVFVSRTALAEVTGLRVLGAISKVRRAAERVPLHERMAFAVAGFAALFLAYVVAMMIALRTPALA
jgi:polysaccharide chain length determinant protein (PEP-CTERM system associated)